MIDFNLDKDDGIELENLVGDLTITDGNNSINFQDTYVDSVFESLLNGIIDLKDKGKTSIELIEESGNLEFEVIGSKLAINYAKNTLYFDLSTFTNNLILTIDKLLNELGDIKKIEINPILGNMIRLRNKFRFD